MVFRIMKREVVQNPSLTSRGIFKRFGREDVSKTTRNRLLEQVAINVKPVTRLPLKRLNWEDEYIKIDL